MASKRSSIASHRTAGSRRSTSSSSIPIRSVEHSYEIRFDKKVSAKDKMKVCLKIDDRGDPGTSYKKLGDEHNPGGLLVTGMRANIDKMHDVVRSADVFDYSVREIDESDGDQRAFGELLEHERTKNELGASRISNSELSQEVSFLKSKNQSVTDNLTLVASDLRSSLETLASSVGVSAPTDDVFSDRDTLADYVAKLASECDSRVAAATVSVIQRERDEYHQKVDDLEAQLTTLSEDFANLKSDSESKEFERDRDLTAKSDKINTLTADNLGKRREIRSLSTKVANLDVKVEGLRTINRNTEAEKKLYRAHLKIVYDALTSVASLVDIQLPPYMDLIKLSETNSTTFEDELNVQYKLIEDKIGSMSTETRVVDPDGIEIPTDASALLKYYKEKANKKEEELVVLTIDHDKLTVTYANLTNKQGKLITDYNALVGRFNNLLSVKNDLAAKHASAEKELDKAKDDLKWKDRRVTDLKYIVTSLEEKLNGDLLPDPNAEFLPTSLCYVLGVWNHKLIGDIKKKIDNRLSQSSKSNNSFYGNHREIVGGNIVWRYSALDSELTTVLKDDFGFSDSELADKEAAVKAYFTYNKNKEFSNWEDDKLVTPRELSLAFRKTMSGVRRMIKHGISTLPKYTEQEKETIDGAYMRPYLWGEIKSIFCERKSHDLDMREPFPVYSDRIDDLEELLTSVRGKMAEIEGTLSEREDYISQLESDIADAKSEIETSNVQIAELEAKTSISDDITAEELFVLAFQRNGIVSNFNAVANQYSAIPSGSTDDLEILARGEIGTILRGIYEQKIITPSKLARLIKARSDELDVDKLESALHKIALPFEQSEGYKQSNIDYVRAKGLKKAFHAVRKDDDTTEAKIKSEALDVIRAYEKDEKDYLEAQKTAQNILSVLPTLKESYREANTRSGQVLEDMASSPVEATIECVAYGVNEGDYRVSFLLLPKFADIVTPLGLQLTKTSREILAPYGREDDPVTISEANGSLRVDVNYSSKEILGENGVEELIQVFQKGIANSLLGQMGVNLKVKNVGEVRNYE